MYSFDEVKKTDTQVADAITAEMDRQNSHIELIASENWVSKAVMAAMGSPMTNKYAEGYPAKRYYGGCECVDIVENLAIERAKELFGCEYVNVQPHSGAQANMAVQFCMLEPGDTVMGMNLDHGGHLTHGSPVNFSGTYFKIVPYGVNDEGFIDYDKVREIALECKPKMIIAGASAYARTIDFKRFREIADEVGAYLMVDMALAKGLMDRDIKLVSGGTDNHLMLVDLTPYDLTGKAVEKLLDSVNITCNKNTIPNDPKSPFVTSGIRLGTPAITSRGFHEEDMDKVAECIAKMIKEGEAASEEVRGMVKELTAKYPLL